MARKSHGDAWWEANTDPTRLRCNAHLRSDGSRCKYEAMLGLTVCWKHGGRAKASVQRTSLTMQEHVDKAEEVLRGILEDDSAAPSDRIKAAMAYMDRAGLGAGHKHEVAVAVKVDPVEHLFSKLLTGPGATELPMDPHDPTQVGFREPLELPRCEDDVVDAELVEDDDEEREADPYTVVVKAPKTPKHIRRDLKRLGLT